MQSTHFCSAKNVCLYIAKVLKLTFYLRMRETFLQFRKPDDRTPKQQIHSCKAYQLFVCAEVQDQSTVSALRQHP